MCKGTNNSDANQAFFHLFLIKITCVTVTMRLSVIHAIDCRNAPQSASASVHQCVSASLGILHGVCVANSCYIIYIYYNIYKFKYILTAAIDSEPPNDALTHWCTASE